MLIDTNIFVDFFRGKQKAKNFLQNSQNANVSILTWMELFVGFPSKNNQNKLSKLINSCNISILQINELISIKSQEIFTNYRHKTGIDIPDSFIAATALVYKQPIYTLNTKHFAKIKSIKVFKPY